MPKVHAGMLPELGLFTLTGSTVGHASLSKLLLICRLRIHGALQVMLDPAGRACFAAWYVPGHVIPMQHCLSKNSLERQADALAASQDNTIGLSKFAAPGGFNDPDMLEVCAPIRPHIHAWSNT